jgi:GT2 family glycosyltransferase
MPKVSIVIPTFNGHHILEKSLPEVIKHSPGAEIIIVDDGSSDGTQDWLKETYPKVRLVTHKKNLGFPRSVNDGVDHAKNDFVALLNNDVYPQKNYLVQALKYFDDKSVFAVTFAEKHSSWPETSWQGGKLQYTRGKDKSRAVYSTWASGGSCIFKKEIWDKLGGYRQIYSPGYWEDIDLGWRAWKSGYKIIWAPEAKVIHDHESTFKTLDQAKLNLIKQRNELLFTWQNISSPPLVNSHIWFLLRYSLTHPGYFKVIFAALSKIARARLIHQPVRSDIEILELVNQPVEND